MNGPPWLGGNSETVCHGRRGMLVPLTASDDGVKSTKAFDPCADSGGCCRVERGDRLAGDNLYGLTEEEIAAVESVT